MDEQDSLLPDFSPPMDLLPDRDVKLASVLEQMTAKECWRVMDATSGSQMTLEDVGRLVVHLLEILPTGTDMHMALQTLIDAKFQIDPVIAMYVAPTQPEQSSSSSLEQQQQQQQQQRVKMNIEEEVKTMEKKVEEEEEEEEFQQGQEQDESTKLRIKPPRSMDDDVRPGPPNWEPVADEKEECRRRMSDGPTIGWEVVWLARDGIGTKTPATDATTKLLGIIVGFEKRKMAKKEQKKQTKANSDKDDEEDKEDSKRTTMVDVDVALIRRHTSRYLNEETAVPVSKLIRGVDLLCPTKHVHAVPGSCSGVIGPFEINVPMSSRNTAASQKKPTARTFYAQEFQNIITGPLRTTLNTASGNAIVIPDRVLGTRHPNDLVPGDFECRIRLYVAMYALTPAETSVMNAFSARKKKMSRTQHKSVLEEVYDPYVHVQPLLPFLKVEGFPEHRRLVATLNHLNGMRQAAETQFLPAWTLSRLLRCSMRFGAGHAPPPDRMRDFSRKTCRLAKSTCLNDYQMETVEWMMRREGSAASIARSFYFEIPCTSTSTPFLLFSPALNKWLWDVRPFHTTHQKLLGSAHRMFLKKIEEAKQAREELREAEEEEGDAPVEGGMVVKKPPKRKRTALEDYEDDYEDVEEDQQPVEKKKTTTTPSNSDLKQLPDIRGGILAEYMGLGKTVEAIALMSASRPRRADTYTTAAAAGDHDKSERRRVDGRLATKAQLYVTVPPHLHILKEEILSRMHWPSLKVLVCHGSGTTKKLTTKQLLHTDIVLTTYTTLAQLVRKSGADCPLLQVHWFRAFIDEVHTVKPGSPIQRILASLSVGRLWLMSGTPVTKQLTELQTLFRLFHLPGFASGALWARVADRTSWSVPDVLPFYPLFRRLMMRHEQHQPYNGRPQLLVLPEKRVLITRIPMAADERLAYKEVEKATQLMLQAFVNRDKSNKKKKQKDLKAVSYLALYRLVGKLQRSCSWSTVNVTEMRQLSKLWAQAASAAADTDAIEDLVRIATERSFTPLADSSCPICWEALSADNAVQTPCRHIFCKVCAKQMTATKGQCALCRVPIPSSASFTLPFFQDAKEACKPASSDEVLLETKMHSKVDSVAQRLISASSTSFSSSSSSKSAAAVREKVVIFSQFPATLDELSQRLERAGVEHVSLRSEVPAQTAKYIKEFSSSNGVHILLAATRTRNSALTLTAARRIIFMEPCYNVAWEMQAIERIYRLTQQNNVTIEYLVMDGTKEERLVQRNQERANALAKTRLSSSSSSSPRSEEGEAKTNTNNGDSDQGWRSKKRRLPLMFVSAGPDAALAPGTIAGNPIAMTSSASVQELCSWIL